MIKVKGSRGDTIWLDKKTVGSIRPLETKYGPRLLVKHIAGDEWLEDTLENRRKLEIA